MEVDIKMVDLQEIQSTNGYEKLMEESKTHPVLLFKHSTTCPISATAFDEYQSFLNHADDSLSAYVIKVIENRNISNHVEADTKIKHESPQIFLIDNKEVSWHTSHSNITAEAIKNELSM